MLKIWSRVIRILWEDKSLLFSSVFFGVMSVLANMGLLGVSAYLLSKANLVDSIGALLVIVVGVRFFGLLRPVLRYLERLFSHNVTFKFLSKIRRDFYKQIEPSAPACLLDNQKGDILSRIVSDADTMRNCYLRVLMPIVVAFISLILGALVLAVISTPLISVAFFISYILIAICVPFIMSMLWKRSSKEIVKKRANLFTTVSDSIEGISELTTFGLLEKQKNHVMEANVELNKLQERKALINEIGAGTTFFLTNLSLILIIIVSAIEIRNGALDGVFLAAVFMVALSVYETITPFSAIYHDISECSEAGNRLFNFIADDKIENEDKIRHLGNSEKLNKLISIDMERIENTKIKNPDITFEKVSFTYKGRYEKAVSNLSLDIPYGSKIAIVGPVGAGKSTIFNLLLRFWEHDEGIIKISDEDINNFKEKELRDLFSIMPQGTKLFHTSIKENLQFGKADATLEEIKNACEKANIAELIESLPEKYETVVGEDGFLFSGGERSRLALARAILKNAPIFLLDEPTAGLDRETEIKVLKDVMSACVGKTVILITHNMANLDGMDQLIRL